MEYLIVTHAQEKDKKLVRMEKFWTVKKSSIVPAPLINSKVVGNAKILWYKNWKALSKEASIIRERLIQSEWD